MKDTPLSRSSACGGHHCHGHVSEKTVSYLLGSFFINLLLSVVEIAAGILSGSVSLIGDALHNTSDAFSILVAVIAFKIGQKKANIKYTYGFKRAEIIGGFVNLILLFVAGIYLVAEGIGRLFSPVPIEGEIIIWVSVLALFIDTLTAFLSHENAGENTNMRMLFLHNLADAFGSVGVIVSGIFVLFWNIYWVDGVIALLIAGYMLYQSIMAFPKIVGILMNAAPDDVDPRQIEATLNSLAHVKGVHHLHIWRVNEHEVSLECHLETDDFSTVRTAASVLKEKFGISHCNIQIEKQAACDECCF